MSIKQIPMLIAQRRQAIEKLTPMTNCNAIADVRTVYARSMEAGMTWLGNASGQ